MSAPDLDKLTASPHWEWRPGMRDEDGWLVTEVGVYEGGGPWLTLVRGSETMYTNGGRRRPDLDHGGTQGEMLPLVRKAWGVGCELEIAVHADGSATVGVWREGCEHFDGDHLGLALAAALLAVPLPQAEVNRG